MNVTRSRSISSSAARALKRSRSTARARPSGPGEGQVPPVESQGQVNEKDFVLPDLHGVVEDAARGEGRIAAVDDAFRVAGRARGEAIRMTSLALRAGGTSGGRALWLESISSSETVSVRSFSFQCNPNESNACAG